MTKSCLATSASKAFSSLTSRETGVVSLTSADSFLADSRVRQAVQFKFKISQVVATNDEQSKSKLLRLTNGDGNASFAQDIKRGSLKQVNVSSTLSK